MEVGMGHSLLTGPGTRFPTRSLACSRSHPSHLHQPLTKTQNTSKTPQTRTPTKKTPQKQKTPTKKTPQKTPQKQKTPAKKAPTKTKMIQMMSMAPTHTSSSSSYNQSQQHIAATTTTIVHLEVLGQGTFGKVFKVQVQTPSPSPSSSSPPFSASLNNNTFSHNNTSIMAKKRILRSDKDQSVCYSAVRECTMLYTFQHPFIISPLMTKISGHGVVDLFMPMANTDLHNWILNNHHLKRHEMVLDVARRLLNALCFLHENGFIHRDIKPSNVLILSNGQVCLADFGSSREYKQNHDANYHDFHSLIQEIGSPLPIKAKWFSFEKVKKSSSSSTPSTHHAQKDKDECNQSLDEMFYKDKKETEQNEQTNEQTSEQTNEKKQKKEPQQRGDDDDDDEEEDDEDDEDESSTKKPEIIDKLQTSGMITYVFRPPEMANKYYNNKCDIYSLGCSLINMIIKSYPKTDSDNPPTPEEWASYFESVLQSRYPDFSMETKQFILSMIQRDPEKRPSARQLLANKIFGYYAGVIVNGTVKKSEPVYPQNTTHLSIYKRYLIWLCQTFGGGRVVYERTWKTFLKFLVEDEKTSNYVARNKYGGEYALVATFRLVCKFVSRWYPKMSCLTALTGLFEENIIRMESNVFLKLNFSIVI